MPGLTADSCSYGRAFANRFLQVRLAAAPLRLATVNVTISGQLLSDDKITPMSGTLGARLAAPVSMDYGINVSIVKIGCYGLSIS